MGTIKQAPEGGYLKKRKEVRTVKNNATLNEEVIFKVTALSYLKEALVKQEYEGCAELVDIAKKFGAQQGEIDGTIAAYLRGDKPGGRNEANRPRNRLGLLLKEE